MEDLTTATMMTVEERCGNTGKGVTDYLPELYVFHMSSWNPNSHLRKSGSNVELTSLDEISMHYVH